MTRRTLAAPMLALALALSATQAPAGPAEDARDLARISNYLNATETVTGPFVQVDPEARVSEGDFFMRRPGRLRFEYEPPNPALVVADGYWVGVIDQRDGSVDRTLLSETPLDLLLKERVDLRREDAVTRIERSDGQLAVTAIDPDNPGLGSITMVFANNPLELRQWVVVDAEGRTTTVALRDARTNVPIANDKFVIPNEPR